MNPHTVHSHFSIYRDPPLVSLQWFVIGKASCVFTARFPFPADKKNICEFEGILLGLHQALTRFLPYGVYIRRERSIEEDEDGSCAD